MNKGKYITIAAAMFAMFTASAQTSKQIPVNEKYVYVNAKERKQQAATLSIAGGLDFKAPMYRGYTSPIWQGKSQRKKHTSIVSLKRRVNKRHKNK